MKNWGKTVEIPVDILNFLILAEATRSAHDELCDPGTGTYHISKVDDTLGVFLSWLWDSDKKISCATLASNFLYQIQIGTVSGCHQREGLSLEDFLTILPLSLSPRLSDSETNELISFLRETIPGLLGESEGRLNFR